MTVPMFDLTIPPLLRGFAVLRLYVDKAHEHATARGVDPMTLMHARLAPDMLSFAGQIQRASDNAKGAIARLTGLTMPAFSDDEATFQGLKERIDRTVALLEAVTPEQLTGSAERPVLLGFRSISGEYRGDQYMHMVLLPNFYFHIATAHGILRQNGVDVGKKDYLSDGVRAV